MGLLFLFCFGVVVFFGEGVILIFTSKSIFLPEFVKRGVQIQRIQIDLMYICIILMQNEWMLNYLLS